MHDRHRLHLLTLVLLSAPLACADDIGMTSGSESTTGTSTGDQSTTNSPTTPPTTTEDTPTTTNDPTTSSSSSTGPSTDTSTSTGPATATDSSTSTGNTDTTAGTTTVDTSGTDTTDGTTTTGGPACPPGEVNCDCDNGFCNGQATCILDKCLPTGDGSCPFEFDFECDEGIFCDFGSDPFDCCPTLQDGNCEEFDFGGQCAPYSDFFDCAYCPFEGDLVCSAPEFCPPNTDVDDCCPTLQDGVCEEMQAGGMCNDGTDPYDCGVCLFEDDGFCDVPFDCPEGSDLNDCCATEQDGVCEEMQFGGMCPDGTDPYDCGICEFENDGFCDVPDLCPEGSDAEDCCATPENGVCEEMQFGGMCQDGTDPYDCGICEFENDGFCDVPFDCPEGTDAVDCCANPQDGNCEEMQFGGMCTDGSDFFDCGYCIYEDDFECDVPQFCPEGTDVNDCA